MSKTVLRRRVVEEKTGLSCSTIYELMNKGEFPRPIQIAPRAVGWLESEIDSWIDARIKATREAA